MRKFFPTPALDVVYISIVLAQLAGAPIPNTVSAVVAAALAGVYGYRVYNIHKVKRKVS